MKPFRLINTLELEQLKQGFTPVLNEWNKTYCRIPLTLELALPTKDNHLSSTIIIQDNGIDLARIDSDYLNTFKEALFGTYSACFNAASEALSHRLIAQFFKTQSCHLQPKLTNYLEWFYPGSSAVLLILSCHKAHLSMLLNPDWVLQQLPRKHRATTKLHSLDEALAKEVFDLDLELIPSTLSVKNLASMQVGDVLTTRHPLNTPLRVMQNNQFFSEAELGKSSHYKSIVLKRSS
jgi:Type III flagellar switch regulator (C-ring) FliN C-term